MVDKSLVPGKCQDDMEMNVRRVDPVKNLIRAIRRNRFVLWVIALCMGVVFRYIYGHSKDYLWHGRLGFISLDISTPEIQLFFLTIFLNSVVAITTGLVAAIICGVALVYVFSEKALFFSTPAIVVYFLLMPRFWRFGIAPNLAGQISVLTEPILVSLVFAGLVWFLMKKTPLGPAARF